MHAKPVLESRDDIIHQELVRVVIELRHLFRELPKPVKIALSPAPPVLGGVEGLLQAILQKLGVEDIDFVSDQQVKLTSFELYISTRLSEVIAQGGGDLGYLDQTQGLERLLQEQVLDDLPDGVERILLEREPSLSIATYASRRKGRPSILLVLPCGLPFDLCRAWFEFLSADYFVVTWETRGLFGDCEDFDRIQTDKDSQIGDLLAVMDHFDMADTHLMGVCGGATLALCAALEIRGRLNSVSLWFGDYNLADNALRTKHQRNFEWMIRTAAQRRLAARELHSLFTDPSILKTVPWEIAYAALLPYANPELFYRYSKLNDGLNRVEVSKLLQDIDLPVLVVTGDNDTTTHSGSSQSVADGIAGSQFYVEPGGSHQGFFSAPPKLKSRAREFIASHSRA